MGRTLSVFLQIGGGDRLVDIGPLKDANPAIGLAVALDC
jgi:hypothetical protein